jgi:hypothetical protein
VSTFLDEKRNEITARMRELEPLIAEYRQLEEAAKALSGVSPATTPARAGTTPRAKGSARPASKKAAPAKRGRPRGSGARGQQALDLVKTHPGISIPELAAAMGIKQNYLYRVMPGLEKDGKVVKRDKGWHVKG